MIIMSDFSIEENMNVLNNAKNVMLENFKSIKWLSYWIVELNKRMSVLEGKKVTGEGEIPDSN